VKVGDFLFPVNFVILGMEEDKHVPLILRIPFLAIARAMVEMNDGKLTLRIGNKEQKFEVGQHNENDSGRCIEAIESTLDNSIKRSKLVGCTASTSGTT
jgi:hypothetical protein